MVVAAPLPFGAVIPAGRLALETGAFALLAVWLVRAALRPTPLPPRPVAVGIVSLLLVGVLQAIPLGTTVVSAVAPLSARIRSESTATGDALEAERRILGRDPRALDPGPTISVDPPATASALRTGAALGALVVVAFTVASHGGGAALAMALLLSAAFQALYGIATLASPSPHIWLAEKKFYLDSATGTLVNRNHFAGLLAASLPCALAWILARASRLPSGSTLGRRLAAALDRRGSVTIFLSLLWAVGLAGLFLSLSRAGIAFGVAASALTAIGHRGIRTGRRLVGLALLVALALVPLAQVGAERLAARYARTAGELSSVAGRAVVWKDTARMIAASPVLGVGFGAFDAAYPLVRSPAVRARYEHAHNDALQLVAEGGIVSALLLALLLVPLLREIPRALTGARGPLAIGFAAGLGAMLAHALVDFNFHIPSNAALACILAGTVLGLGWNSRA